eukprot:5609057-Lingulodinium_polyedra.AAC.1
MGGGGQGVFPRTTPADPFFQLVVRGAVPGQGPPGQRGPCPQRSIAGRLGGVPFVPGQGPEGGPQPL